MMERCRIREATYGELMVGVTRMMPCGASWQAAWCAYTKLGLVLVGLEIRSPVNGSTRVLMNPVGMTVPPVGQYAVHGLVLTSCAREAHRLRRANLFARKSVEVRSWTMSSGLRFLSQRHDAAGSRTMGHDGPFPLPG